MRPFLRWVGGKYRSVDRIRALLPGTFRTYWEPFLGGGSVFFDLKPPKAQLSDLNKDLITTYISLVEDPDAVIYYLRKMSKAWKTAHSKKLYYQEMRAAYNQRLGELSAIHAALFIFLNKTCFNGLYRVNRSGGYNTPVGSFDRHSQHTICDAVALKEAAAAMRSAVFRSIDYRQIQPEQGDLVYCDPPYTGTFGQYTATDFDAAQLAATATQWARAGAYVAISERDTPAVRERYRYWRLNELSVQTSVAAKGASRSRRRELLITSWRTP